MDFDAVSSWIFHHWLQTGIANSLPPKSAGITVHESQDALFDMNSRTQRAITDCMASIESLTNAWIMGDYLVAPQFQNDVIDELTCAYGNYWHYRNDIPWPQMMYTCQNTLPNSPIHKVMLDLMLFVTSIKPIDGDLRRLLEECGFAGSVGPLNSHPSILGNGVRRPAPWNRSRAYYHIKPRGGYSSPMPWYLRRTISRSCGR